MNIKLNGKPHEIPQSSTVSDLLESLSLAGKPVVVEHNKAALFARDYAKTVISQDDVLEIITIAAGG